MIEDSAELINVDCSRLENAFTGKIFAIVVMNLGALYIGKNISDMKNKGSIDALTIAGAASILGINDVKARIISRAENKKYHPRLPTMLIIFISPVLYELYLELDRTV